MPIQQPGRGPFGRGSVSRCGQGGYRGALGLRRGPIFRSPDFLGAFSVSGVTKDATGAVLAGVYVELFLAGSNQLLAAMTSDGVGAYSFAIGTNQAVYVRAYKAGAPDVSGTSAVFQPTAV